MIWFRGDLSGPTSGSNQMFMSGGVWLSKALQAEMRWVDTLHGMTVQAWSWYLALLYTDILSLLFLRTR